MQFIQDVIGICMKKTRKSRELRREELVFHGFVSVEKQEYASKPRIESMHIVIYRGTEVYVQWLESVIG